MLFRNPIDYLSNPGATTQQKIKAIADAVILVRDSINRYPRNERFNRIAEVVDLPGDITYRRRMVQAMFRQHSDEILALLPFAAHYRPSKGYIDSGRGAFGRLGGSGRRGRYEAATIHVE